MGFGEETFFKKFLPRFSSPIHTDIAHDDFVAGGGDVEGEFLCFGVDPAELAVTDGVAVVDAAAAVVEAEGFDALTGGEVFHEVDEAEVGFFFEFDFVLALGIAARIDLRDRAGHLLRFAEGVFEGFAEFLQTLDVARVKASGRHRRNVEVERGIRAAGIDVGAEEAVEGMGFFVFVIEPARTDGHIDLGAGKRKGNIL